MAISISTPSILSPPPRRLPIRRFPATGANLAAVFRTFPSCRSIKSSSISDLHSCQSKLESLFCYDKSIPEEIIETPVDLSLTYKEIGNSPPCIGCHSKGAVLCATCSGSGLYVDSILESQGIIVKVRCLGCGGTGNIMCLECGGRGHI